MQTTLLILIIALLAVAIVLIFMFRGKSNNEIPQLQYKIGELQSSLAKIETNLKEDFRINREESSNTAKTNREELNKAITEFRNETAEAIRLLSKQNVEALEKLMGPARASMEHEQFDPGIITHPFGPDPKRPLGRSDGDHPHASREFFGGVYNREIRS